MKTNTPQAIKIVTVDDSLVIAERLQVILSELTNVTYLGNARNVASALNLMKDMTPDVVILDINLQDNVPASNGISLLTTLKNTYLDIKVIMLTNLTDTYYRNRCIGLGADYFLDKSHDFDKIPEVLAQMNNKYSDK